MSHFLPGTISMLDKASLVTYQTYNQWTFYRQRAKSQFVISRNFLGKKWKKKLRQNERGLFKIEKLISRYGIFAS